MNRAFKQIVALLLIVLTTPLAAQKSYKLSVDYKYDFSFIYSSNGYAAVRMNDKYGYIDRDGNLAIDFMYDNAQTFMDNGLALVSNNRMRANGFGFDTYYSLINHTGQVVTYLNDYSSVFTYIGEYAKVLKNGKWGLIDQAGKLIIDCKFESLSSYFDQGLAPVKLNGKHGYIDKKGNIVIECKFDDANDFSDNGLAVVGKDDKYGYINTTGKFVIDIEFDDASDFYDSGIAKVKKGDKKFYIDEDGRTLPFDEVRLPSKNGLSAVRKGTKWGFINLKRKVVIDFQFDGVTDFSDDGLAGVNKDGKRGYIDITGNPVIDFKFEQVWGFNKGYGTVLKGNKLGVVDKTGKFVVDCVYDGINYFPADGLTPVMIGKKWGFIDINGKQVVDCQYDEVKYFTSGVCPVRKGNKWGYIDATGNVVVALQFDEPGFAHNGFITVKKNGKYGCYRESNPQKELEDFIRPEFAKWQQKGKYESSDAYLARVSEANSKKKAEELMHLAVQKIAPSYCDWRTFANDYDPDNQTFKLEVVGIPPFYLKVPVTEAEAFDTSSTKLQFSDIQYAMNPSGKFFLQRATITNPTNDKVYNYSSENSATFAVNQFNLNYDPLKLNVSVATNNQAVSTESTVVSIGQSDVDMNIPVNPQTNHNTFVVIIANENYQKEVRVKFAANDGRVFKEYCEKTLGIPSQNIHFVVDATYGNMKSEIKWIADVIAAYNGEAKAIFYYAGHGMPNENDKSAYLLPVDGFSADFETAIKLTDLYARLTAKPAQKVAFILDACFSGSARDNAMLAEARGVKVKPRAELLAGNSIVISAATGDETAYPYASKQHGLFTYFLLKKLQETNGNATYKDLFDYIKTNVGQQSVVVNQKLQTPQLQVSSSLENWETMKLH
jgi:hypothetical protein